MRNADTLAPHLSSIVDVTLDQLPHLAAQMEAQMRSAGFVPQCIVYLESGGRLIASELCQRFEVGAVPLKIQRKGGGLKRILARYIAALPTAGRDAIRRIEARWFWGRMSGDAPDFHEVPVVDLTGIRVLIVDDAVDSGTSICRARDWVFEMGAVAAEVRSAAITVTMEAGRSAVDFAVYERHCRFPWSSDSRERNAYEKIYARTCLPIYSGRPV